MEVGAPPELYDCFGSRTISAFYLLRFTGATKASRLEHFVIYSLILPSFVTSLLHVSDLSSLAFEAINASSSSYSAFYFAI